MTKLMTFANETITVADFAASLTSSVYAPGNAQAALITVETATIRWWASGATPTATTGHLAQPGDIITLTDPNEIRSFRAIRTTSTSAALQVSYAH